MMTVEERYLNDSEFHNLVDLLETMIRRYQFTPSEIREAAMFAAIRYEIYHAQKPLYYKIPMNEVQK
jgi:hypothetical protein